MKISSVHIENFRGLKDVVVPLSDFGCLIGENNSGKSSVLQAILLLLPGSGKKAQKSDFYDSSTPIRIELQIDEIDEADLARIANDQHRASFAPDVVDGSIRLVRVVDLIADSTLKTQLLVSRLGPREERWTEGALAAVMKGKSNPELREEIVTLLPELDGDLATRPTQKDAQALRAAYVEALPGEDKIHRDGTLGTGLDVGIKGFLPEPIYIEAVKDVADEVKTTDTATFGKLLGLLLEEVQEQFADVEEKFRDIQKQLSRVIGADGTVVDDRIDEVKLVEATINGFVKESFPDVGLTISVPVPKMKTILSSAEISADDGHEGPITSKGDGLKRAVAFAILRAYTALRASGISAASSGDGNYWLLFEEPELYLYPRAQKQLFSALEIFSKDYPVLVTTHSPIFFDAASTKSFVKFRKVRPVAADAPFTEVDPIVISDDDLHTKTAFQIICHENNSIGFFAKQVVLVEGDSDALLLPHLAKLLDPEWDAVEKNIAFARTNGKGNIANYRTFFAKFRIPVHVVCDLDALVGGFDKLDPSDAAKNLRGELLTLVDAHLESGTEITAGEANRLGDSGEARGLWRAAEEARAALDGSEASFEELASRVNAFFAFRRKGERLASLEDPSPAVKAKKGELISSLRQSQTNVLSLGAIENYYASSSTRRDKVKQAIDFCAACTELDAFRDGLGEDASVVEVELREIMQGIFGLSGPSRD